MAPISGGRDCFIPGWAGRSKPIQPSSATPRKRNLRGGDEGSPEYQDVGQEINALMERYLEHLRITGGDLECPDTDPEAEIPAGLIHYGRETAYP
ncbi:hypothetical protein V499_00463 [Pseudogymnoascus sp. VKM F-103]|nr:hypothetical protein V499_00463 [Pseudogymnoascus sp. VKM F-103]